MIDKLLLKALRKCSKAVNNDSGNFGRNWNLISNKAYSNGLIHGLLESSKPCMIGRFGSTEMNCLVNFLGYKYPEKYKSIRGFINSKTPMWWRDELIASQLKNWSGFFPATDHNIDKFCNLMISALPNLDLLGSWLRQEEFFKEELSHTKMVMLEDLEPFFAPNPWTSALKDKKVLVVHPFAESIMQQYLKKDLVFPDLMLPKFDLQVIKAVQTIAGENSKFSNWFEALESMQLQIAKTNFDICIIGCGAYGFPLASFVKEFGKKAFHLAGATQLLFGIKGGRWESYQIFPYKNLFNEHWVRPSKAETPSNAKIVENSCYW